jgi:alkylation response protein AidB-like acyl-CoA dehydrogenase
MNEQNHLKAFRADLANWLDDALKPFRTRPHRDDWQARRQYDCAWQRTLFDAGYAGLTWPEEHGGRGLSAAYQMAFVEECAKRAAPNTGITVLTPAMAHVAPVLIAEGSREQQQRHLPRILRGEEVWCQGFTEANAGSDIAAVETVAATEGDFYVLNGAKVWISYAQIADHCEMLVRVGPPGSRHKGLAWLMVPMDTPGISVTPVKTMHDEYDACTIELRDARVPIRNRVGAETDGWRLTMITFGFERTLSAVPEIVFAGRLLSDLEMQARADAVLSGRIADQIGELRAELFALKYLAQQNIASFGATGLGAVGGSILKLEFSNLRRRISHLAYELLGQRFLEGERGSKSGEFDHLW